jgi:hypothetical protein
MGNPDDIHGFEKGGEKKGNRVITYTNDLNIALRDCY